MKKFTTMAYVAALALVSTAGLTSCSNEEPGTGNYNGETVKTEFSIALPSQLGSNGAGVNRMPSANVQRDGMSQFQGIKDIYLIPFAVQGDIASSSTRLGNNVSLGTLNKNEVDTKKNNAKLFENVSIPLTTASFLFYGKSAADNSDAAKKFKAGSLISYFDNAANTPASFYFDLEQIQSNVNTITGTGSHGYNLMAYLTSIACASDGLEPARRWYEYTDVAAMDSMFHTFTSMKGLSSFEVERVLTDLYQSLLPLSSPIANGIKAAIENATYATVNASDEVELVDDLDNFPEEFNLPSGSIDMVWDGTNHIFKVGTYSGMALPTVYTYPAQLWYTANSQIKTSNQSQKTLYQSTTNYWKDVLAAHTDGPAVNTRTRAVAIEDTIQYAVGRLDVQVKLGAASLEDNSDIVEGGDGTDVTPASGFKVTAVLIGGQKQVGFDFTPNGEGTEYTIFDKVMTSTEEDPSADMVAANGSYSALNHTLVLENGTSDVMIAIEMENNSGVDFYGYKGQLVPKDGKFYVCAKLTASLATETGNHVFKQDYTTTARLSLTSLRNAYNTLPDLRTPELEIGFAVDLTWQSGHTYTIDIE